MVYNFTSNVVTPPATIYVGKDKFESMYIFFLPFFLFLFFFGGGFFWEGGGWGKGGRGGGLENVILLGGL